MFGQSNGKLRPLTDTNPTNNAHITSMAWTLRSRKIPRTAENAVFIVVQSPGWLG
jgi:hypothetical protein